MKITLTVLNAPPGNPISGQQLQLASGQALGRAAGCDIVLPDDSRVISSRHAEVHLQGGLATLIDLSTNGTFVNGEPEAIGKGSSRQLQNGDQLAVGDYLFSVTLAAQADLPVGLESVGFLDNSPAAQPSHAPDPFAPATAETADTASDEDYSIDDLDQWLEPLASSQPASDPWQSNTPLGGGVVGSDPLTPQPMGNPSLGTDPLGLDQGPLGLDPLNPQQGSPFNASPLDADPLNSATIGGSPQNTDPLAAFEQADRSSLLAEPTAADDDNWWQSEADNAPANQMAMPQITPQAAATITQPPVAPSAVATPPAAAPIIPNPGAPVTPAGPASPQAAELAELLELKGLSAEQQAALVPDCAGIVRHTSNHLVGLLQARASIKNELRASRTMIQTEENNPLKFSAGAADAMQAMFSNSGKAFLAPQQAVQESFEDIADHQVAVLYAMKAAFNEMLAHFSPAELELKFDGKSGMLGNRKAKSWDNYCDYFEQLQRDRENSYSQLFGAAFAEAYEAKLVELKSSRSLNRAP